MTENFKNLIIFLVQSLSCVRLFATSWAVIPGFPDLHYHPKFAQTHVYWIIDASNHLILYHPLLLLLSLFPGIRVIPNELALCIRWPKYWSFSVTPSNIQDWFPLGLTGLISLKSKGLSKVFSNTTFWKFQFFSTQPPLWSNSHSTWL